MGRMILLSSLILILGGLALLIYTDPQFRLIFSSGGTTLGSGSSFTTFARNFTGTFSGNFTRFAGRGATRATAFGFSTTSEIETLVGVGLAAVGVVLVGIEMFLNPVRTG
jgi:hypothetical protein